MHDETDLFDLERFIEAQDSNGTYLRATAELQRGVKVSHWMWFVFPQIAGLGMSSMTQKFAISSLSEAEAYLRHPVLGLRLLQCTRIVSELDATAEQAFGATDAMKLRSSMTLFARAAPDEPLFRRVLVRHFSGVEDPATVLRL